MPSKVLMFCCIVTCIPFSRFSSVTGSAELASRSTFSFCMLLQHQPIQCRWHIGSSSSTPHLLFDLEHTRPAVITVFRQNCFWIALRNAVSCWALKRKSLLLFESYNLMKDLLICHARGRHHFSGKRSSTQARLLSLIMSALEHGKSSWSSNL